jgi:ABC-type glycerol-3-phosphate transport system substrate-binding protein
MIATKGNTDAALKWLEFATSPDGLNLWAKNAAQLSASSKGSQVTDIDPLTKELKAVVDSGRVYYRGDVSILGGNYRTEWQNFCQSFFADGIDAYARGVSAENYVDTKLRELDTRFKALK